MFQANFVEEIKIHFVFISVFRKSCRLCDNVEKYYKARQAIYGNMAHAHCMLDT